MKPLILVSPDDAWDKETHRPLYLVKRSYSLALSGAGAVPYMAVEPRFFQEYATLADGLLLTDGNEILNPGRCGEQIDPSWGSRSWYEYPFSYTRDSFDLPLCKAFLDAEKPILGIGRGAIVINAVLGGRPDPTLLEAGRKSTVRVTSTEIPGEIADGISARCYHPQTAGSLGTGLRVAAVFDDGNIAAFIHQSLPVLGVLWNPETEGTDDCEAYAAKASGKPILPDPVKKALLIEQYKCMKPLEGEKTDADAPRTENPVFAYFVSLCRGGKKDE